MSHETCKTVRIKSHDPKTQGAFIEINESDYDAKKHGPIIDGAPATPPGRAVIPPKPPKYDGLNFADDAARNMAVESGLDFSKVKGTGAKKAITVEDVQKVIDASKAPKIDFASDEAAELFSELALTDEDAEAIKGTGANGSVTVKDLEDYVDSKGNR